MMGRVTVVDRVDQFQRRHPVLGFPLAVAYKFFDDAGAYLAALMTYYAFVSLFPVLLLLTTISSILLINHPDWQRALVDSTLGQVPLLQEGVGNPHAITGSPLAVAISSVIAIYGALGVGNALQFTMNTVWAVPRNSRPNPFLIRARSLALIVTVGVAAGATTVASTLVGSVPDWGGWTKSLAIVVTLLINTSIAAAVYRVGIRGTAPGHQLAGALFAAVCWQLLQTIGIPYIGGIISRSSVTNGVFALAIGFLVYVFIMANVAVIGAEINVVRAKQLYPRALLTPFTDAVELTEADKRAYAHQAQAARSKGFERIEVHFVDGHLSGDREQDEADEVTEQRDQEQPVP